jgi:hypothetical protein
MIAYASWTGTKSTLALLQKGGWRLLMSPETLRRTKGKARPKWNDGSNAPYCLDNGAWSCFQQEKPFDEEAFMWALEEIGQDADFVVVPDIVEGGLESLEYSKSWLQKLGGHQGLLLIAVQDGMSPEDVEPLINKNIGLFLGGSTEWKLESLPAWGKLSQRKQCYFHVGRVNSRKRINMCALAGAHSFDGTSVTQFPRTFTRLNNAKNQQTLWSGL